MLYIVTQNLKLYLAESSVSIYYLIYCLIYYLNFPEKDNTRKRIYDLYTHFYIITKVLFIGLLYTVAQFNFI